MPKEAASLSGMLLGDEPGPLARILHSLSGDDEGIWGERCIAELLGNRVSGVGLFQNVYVPVKDRTTELDLVLVGQTGVYVFESKAYGGKIYGSPERTNWVQYIGNTKNSFYNPVQQNENHRRHLAQALQLPKSSIFSFIIFENRADLSKVTPLEGDDFIVCNRKRLLPELKKLSATKKVVLSQEECAAICEKLKEWSVSDAATRSQHIQQVQTRMFGEECPVCGKKLVERSGKYGTFLGCTGYPKCRYTREKQGTVASAPKS